MGFTFDLAIDVGRVRLLIRDTDTAAAKFLDEEITGFLGLEGLVRGAAAACLEALAAKLSQECRSERIGDYQYDQSNSPKALLDTAAYLSHLKRIDLR
jgi:hypothetical protein